MRFQKDIDCECNIFKIIKNTQLHNKSDKIYRFDAGKIKLVGKFYILHYCNSSKQLKENKMRRQFHNLCPQIGHSSKQNAINLGKCCKAKIWKFPQCIDYNNRRSMGNNSQTVLQTQPNDSNRQVRSSLKSSKPGSKTVFKYIAPVSVDEGDDMDDEQQNAISPQISKQMNQQEYLLMEQGEGEGGQCEEIKVKWNSFIKMKKRNYLDDYIIIKEIGRGGFGKVNKVRSKYTGLFRAAKKIKKSTLGKQEHQKLFMEMAIMKSLDHINIIRLYEVYDYKSHYVLILQLCEGGELFKKIITSKELPQDYIARIVKQILKVLLYLSHVGVVHRDLKPQNMLFEKNSQIIKIIDFGIAHQKQDNEKLTQRVGTPYYVAPQVLLKKYDEKCDVWSTGVIMYMMLTHRPPFRGDNEVQVMQKILGSEPPLKEDLKSSKYSAQCLQLVKRMLVKNPDERISAKEAYEHAWIKAVKDDDVPQNEKDVVQSIETFKFKNKLEAVVYTFIVSQLLTTDEKANFIEIFEDLDRNHDGVISKIEFQNCLKSKSSIPEGRMSLLMRVIDTNSSGYIDLTEFIVACLKMKDVVTKSHFQQAFAYFDIDHSGNISFEEIAFFLGDASNNEEIIKKIFQQVDQNSDGVISKQQFVRLLMRESQKKLKGTNKKL